ncbi:unnamed protein product [Urochloa humidicola]
MQCAACLSWCAHVAQSGRNRRIRPFNLHAAAGGAWWRRGTARGRRSRIGANHSRDGGSAPAREEVRNAEGKKHLDPANSPSSTPWPSCKQLDKSRGCWIKKL